MSTNGAKILYFAFLFSIAFCGIVKRETFTVKSTFDEEEIFKNDILGKPLNDEDFENAKLIEDTNDEVDETRSQGTMYPTLIAGLYEGDIRGINDTEGRNGILSGSKKWPGAVIPYVISSGYNSAERATIARAMNFYHKNTCIRFKPRSNQRDYIHITRGSGCSSYVGRSGGVQYVSLGYGCINSGTIQHELMHAAGFWHEQSRYDRDRYVTIVWSNILQGMQFNFQKYSKSNTQTFGESYDYNSAMHYPAYAFTKYRGRATIVPKQKGVSIGNKRQLSTIDLKKLNSLYECSGTPTGTTKKPTNPVTTRKPTTKKPGNLVDRNRHCGYWARTGECTKNPKYMAQNCQKSCSQCKNLRSDPNCVDRHRYCISWASSNQCNLNPQYMRSYCKRSCNLCSNSC